MERRITGGALVLLGMCLFWLVPIHLSWFGRSGIEVLLGVYGAVLVALGIGVRSGKVRFDESVRRQYQAFILYLTVSVVVLMAGLTFLTLA